MSKKKAKKDGVAEQPAATFGRVELQAPPEWIEELDAVAKAVGVSRSAYLRLAANERMVEDRKRLGMTEKPREEKGGDA